MGQTVTLTEWTMCVDSEGERSDHAFERTYNFSGLPPPEPNILLTIECSIRKSPVLHIQPGLDFELRPHRQPLPRSMKRAPFPLFFYAESVTEFEEVLSGNGMFEVNMFSSYEPDTACFQLFPRDVALCINAIATGEELTFKYQSFNLTLPNDRKFKYLYASIYDKVERLPHCNY